MTWRHGIVQDLHSAGLRGYLPRYIQEFLKNRVFQVRIGSHQSDVKPQINGVPQGSILAVTLFALKINGVAKIIPNRPGFISSLYVDDLQIGFRHCDLNVVRTEMQQCLVNVYQWAQQNGFKFSITKTKAMHFTTVPGLHINRPQFSIGNHNIPYTESIKFLGLIWDTKLLWREHIDKLKSDCSKLLGLLKTISAQNWGADQYSMLKIYRTYIRAKLDYGAPVYSSAAATTLDKLNTVVTDALRIATGAFKSTPTDSLHILANEMKLSHRRDYLSLRYFYKTKSNTSNPATQHLIPLCYRTLFRNKAIPQPLSLRIQQSIEKYQLRKQFVKPSFSYKLLGISIPTYAISKPDINMELNEYPKLVTPPSFYRSAIARLLSTEYARYMKLYTDGSKRETGVGAAVSWNGRTRRATLPREATIYSAEMHAISMAVHIINEEPAETLFVILSDSYSALITLLNLRATHPVARKIIHDISRLQTESGKTVKLCWVPSHVGVAGNEEADKAAVAAARGVEEYIGVEYRDWYPHIRTKIEADWSEEWKKKRQKLSAVKGDATPWKSIKTTCRRDEVVINRLRAGHCLATHRYLMEGPDAPPVCEQCNNAVLTVKHMLLECPAYDEVRRRLEMEPSTAPGKLKSLIGDEMRVEKVIKFLKVVEIYGKI